jgi:DNA-binding transcriptional ArsR family regulator
MPIGYLASRRSTTPADPLSTTFAALSDPTRRAILARLALGEATVSDLAAPFDMSLPGISKHLKVLQRAGLVEQGRQAQWRPCRLRAEPLQDVADWVAQYRRHWVAQYRRHWEASLERLDAYLHEIQAGPTHTDGENDDHHDTDRSR